MKKFLMAVLAGLTLCGLSLSAQAYQINSSSDAALVGGTVITFDQAVGGFNSLSIGNVTFNGSGYITDDFAGQYNTNGRNMENGLYGFKTLNISFAAPVKAFGFNWGASNAEWHLNAYDAVGNLLETRNMPETWFNNGGDFYGLADSGIKSASLVFVPGTYTEDHILIDNFSYKAVPEPASMLLLGSGLLSLIGLKKKNTL